MNLNKPKDVTFIIAVVLAVLGLLGFFVPALAAYSLWLILVGFIVLAAGNLVAGL